MTDRVDASTLPSFITATEAGALLGYSPKVVRQMCAAGELPAFRPAGRTKWILSRDKILELVESSKPQVMANGR